MVLPEIFIAFSMFAFEGLSMMSSLVLRSLMVPEGGPPIRLEKKISPLSNNSTPSVKKALFSSKVCSKGPRLSLTSSNAVCPKSGTNVKSKVKLSLIPYFKSKPAVILVSVSLSRFETSP